MAPHSQVQVFRNGCYCGIDILETKVLFIQRYWLYRQTVDRTVLGPESPQLPSIFTDLEDTNGSIASRRIQLNSVGSRCPLHVVDRTVVLLVPGDFDPFVILVLENSDLFLETANCDDLSELRVGPGNSPDCCFVSK